jgi:hypothetical protein
VFFVLEVFGERRSIVRISDVCSLCPVREPGPDRDEMSDLLMLALIVVGLAAAAVYAQFLRRARSSPDRQSRDEN